MSRPPLSGKVNVRSRRVPTLEEAIHLLDEIADAIPALQTELRWMNDLAYGGRAPHDRSQNGRRQRDDVGPPTPDAWGEVPNDSTVSALLSSPRYRGAFKIMRDRVLTAHTATIKAFEAAEKALGEATSGGSPLPRMAQWEYLPLLAHQARRRARGEL